MYAQLDGNKFPWALAVAPTEPVLGPTRRLIPPVSASCPSVCCRRSVYALSASCRRKCSMRVFLFAAWRCPDGAYNCRLAGWMYHRLYGWRFSVS